MSSNTRSSAPSESRHYTPLAQALADTQASLQRASNVIESAYQRLALLRESIRRNLDSMPHDLPEPSPLTGASPAMGPNHAAIVLSDQPGTIEPHSHNSSTITESYERTRNSSSPQRPPWVSWNGFTINPYDQRIATAQPVDLRAPRRSGSTNPPTRRSLVEHYFTYRRDPNPNDASTSLGRSVEGRSSSSNSSTSSSQSAANHDFAGISVGYDGTISRIRDVATDIESVITRLNRQRDELSHASGGFRRTGGAGNVDAGQEQQQQQQPEFRSLFEQMPRSSSRTEGNVSNSNGSYSSAIAENQRSAWRTVSPPQDPQRLSAGSATRVRARARAGPVFPHSPTAQTSAAGPSAATTATNMTNPSRTERSHRTVVYPPPVPVVTISDNENYNEDSEDEVEPFEFWLDRVRRESFNRLRSHPAAQPLPPPPASGGTGMNTVPPPVSLQNALRERLDRLRFSFGGGTSGESMGQRSTMSGMNDGLTNGRRRRRGWGKWLLRSIVLWRCDAHVPESQRVLTRTVTRFLRMKKRSTNVTGRICVRGPRHSHLITDGMLGRHSVWHHGLKIQQANHSRFRYHRHLPRSRSRRKPDYLWTILRGVHVLD